MKKNKNKGFTLVELLVVIAVLAILASVSVIGYMGFTQKAKESNDVTMTTQMNNVLQANEASSKALTMADVVIQLDEAGLDLNKLNPTAEGYNYVWDRNLNRIFLLNKDKKVVAPNDKKISSIEDTYVMVRDNAGAKEFLGYSLYLQDGFKLGSDEVVEFSSNLESGNNKGLKLMYKDNKKETVNITTQGGELTLDNPNASVYHKGSAKIVDIKNVDLNNSYHLDGQVTEKIIVTNARVVVSEKSAVTNIELSPKASTESKLVIEENVKQDIVISSKSETAKIEVQQDVKNESKIYVPETVISEKSTVKQESKVTEFVLEQKTKEDGSKQTIDEMLHDLEREFAKKANIYIKLGQNITLPSVALNDALVIPEDKTVVLDLNGKTLAASLRTGYDNRHNYTIAVYGSLTLIDSVGTGLITGRGVENFGDMVVKGGTIKAVDVIGGACIWNEGNLEIHGGNFIVDGAHQVGSASDGTGVGAINNMGTTLITAGIFKDVNKRTYSIISTGDIVIDPISSDSVIVEGAHGALAIDSGTGSVYGGHYSSTDFYGLYVSNDGVGEDPKDAAVKVYGGTFTGKKYSVLIGSDYNNPVNSTIAIYGGTYLKPLTAQKDITRDNAISIFGGVFADKPEAKFILDGWKVVKNKDGLFEVVKK